MKALFYALLVLWIGGGIVGGLIGGPSTQAFFANVFGIPTIIIGVILLVRRLKSGRKEPKPDE